MGLLDNPGNAVSVKTSTVLHALIPLMPRINHLVQVAKKKRYLMLKLIDLWWRPWMKKNLNARAVTKLLPMRSWDHITATAKTHAFYVPFAVLTNRVVKYRSKVELNYWSTWKTLVLGSFLLVLTVNLISNDLIRILTIAFKLWRVPSVKLNVLLLGLNLMRNLGIN